MDVKDPNPLPVGTLIECDMFLAVVVRDDLLLVCSTDFPGHAPEGCTLELCLRGPNTWVLEDWVFDGFMISRGFDGSITADWAPDYRDDYEWDWDDYFFDHDWEHEWLDAWDDYRSLSSPARIPRADRAFACRHRSGGRRRR